VINKHVSIYSNLDLGEMKLVLHVVEGVIINK